ncbi:carbohydrate ABC transporter permease [Microbacterium azadirachtae]|uniref:Lactose transport system permease protein LacF n=1 Tax=Microbacterium azadirachtae TaxID=582680 RepID=A0A0F0LKD0_9MICO|nr:sugar ABC transporter permease [Microbacterium azadirachtae]KJL33603.1 Lactose transport system permease protein LacF [Microbacterium azadirachtae]UXW85706.1 sugar ABC transporter permease [Microbacterium azadirachtae]SDL74911.1 carbohydrate ABC transporter membrane protein 1, CUT1 family [Microbacterium azadirachtae]SEG04111.1 carbohydrate ABC transporter membrane protein 1, CUT1 family [Microbacterium azadirachtae]SEG06887.1 carbohydrate ABC transporter membrane protein 1, CUT1 family [Mi
MTTPAIDDRRAAKRRADRHRYRDTRLAYLLLAPVVILLGIFVIWPAVYAGFLSFQDWSFYKDPQFVGWKNYADVLTDPLFVATIGRGFLFVLMTVPPMLVLAFLFASLVVSVSRRFATVLKVSIYIPTIISSVIASIVFVLIYTYDGGILNAVLAAFHIDAVAWIGDPAWALLSVAVPAVWLGMGITSLIMVAAMVDIPTEYYEAAAMEGAGWWQKTFYITMPQMKNVFLYLLITGFVAAIQQFELPLVMTQGGPLDSTTLPNLFIFNHFRNDVNVGYSIAAALLLFVVLGSVSALVFKFINSERLVD